MICKKCKRECPENAIFCPWCGERQVRDTNSVNVPKPVRKADGTFKGQLMINGKRVYVYGATEKEYYSNARAYKAGVIALAANPDRITLTDAITKYIESKDGVLSPGTIRTYRNYQRNRFKGLMSKQVGDITDSIAQSAVNAESKDVSPKVVKDAWHFIATVLSGYNVQITVKLPQVVVNKKQVLTPEQVVTFCHELKGTTAELPALLGLHSLRISEVLGVQWKDIDLDNRYISVHGARVLNAAGELVYKETNKNDTSRRIVPIMSDQLLEALKAERPEDYEPDAFVVDHPPHVVTRRVRNFCRAHGYPELSMHSLRHTFASLGAHLQMSPDTIKAIGGWADDSTMKKIYTHTYQTDIKNAENELSRFFNAK